MPTMPELAAAEGLDCSKLEAYFIELLNKLERIAAVMERFDNVMNPTLGLAEDALDAERRLPPQEPDLGISTVTLRSVRSEE